MEPWGWGRKSEDSELRVRRPGLGIWGQGEVGRSVIWKCRWEISQKEAERKGAERWGRRPRSHLVEQGVIQEVQANRRICDEEIGK